MDYEEIRQQVYETTMQALKLDLIYLSAGNISARAGENAVAITPSGIKYDELKPEDVAIVDLDGNIIDAPRKPSSETPMHTYVMKHRPSVNAICHTHSPFAITFAILGKTVPQCNLELWYVGGPIPVAPWACPGTLMPGEEATKLLDAHPELGVVLLRNHGLLAVGGSLPGALDMAFNAETGMKTYHQALQVGQPVHLEPSQIAEVNAVYKS